ncbi:YlbL family protein [Streptomyces crystallinus]|uniref:Lon proteolytic domain-containing protein n=1 Tax=Streptomyces crystallinus TaxID=68191 RepID=A0ABP3RJV9_9ACTN
MHPRHSRLRNLAIGSAPVVALFAVVGFAPLPFSVAQPGPTANVLGDDKGKPVITIEGRPARPTTGQLRMVTIVATGPSQDVGISDVVRAWFRTDRAVMPRNSVYPSGGSDEEISEHNRAEMKESQDSATAAALNYLHLGAGQVKVTLNLADVGGPSAGLLFSLGIVDKLVGNGSGGELTGGRTIAGTGTIEADGSVGAVGGVSLKTQAARRDGATVFLVPKAECADARAELPSGLRLIPVTTLSGAVSALKALDKGADVPSC